MVLRQLLAVAALGAALLLDQTKHVEACSCIEQYRSVCDFAAESTVVAHVKALDSTRDQQENINDDVTFLVEIQELYKGATEDSELLSFSFTTCGNSACCGVDLTVGDHYLIGLYGDGDDLYADSCGLFRPLDSVTDEELAELEGCGDENEDPCNGSCGEYEECLVHIDGDGEEPYCADTCAPGRCGDEETCTLEEVECVRAPCPPVAVCTDTPLPTPTIAGYEGCFKDREDDRVLGHQFDAPDMTTDLCVAHCHEEGAAYAATQYGYECWCYVTGRSDFDRHGTEEGEDGAVCETPCAGDADEVCGGTWAFSLYKLPWPKAPTADEEFLACYRDTPDERVMSDAVTLDNMTPAICREHCYDKHAKYYATQYGSECWCGSSNKISDYNKHGEGVCHLPCTGDEEYACGGFYAFDLFKYPYAY